MDNFVFCNPNIGAFLEKRDWRLEIRNGDSSKIAVFRFLFSVLCFPNIVAAVPHNRLNSFRNIALQ